MNLATKSRTKTAILSLSGLCLLASDALAATNRPLSSLPAVTAALGNDEILLNRRDGTNWTAIRGPITNTIHKNPMFYGTVTAAENIHLATSNGITAGGQGHYIIAQGANELTALYSGGTARQIIYQDKIRFDLPLHGDGTGLTNVTDAGAARLFAGATTLYVDPNGNDATAIAGRPDKPWSSPHIALTNAGPANTVYIMPGTYYIGTNALDLHPVSDPGGAGIHLIGIGNPELIGIRNLKIHGAQVVPGNGSYIENLRIICGHTNNLDSFTPGGDDPTNSWWWTGIGARGTNDGVLIDQPFTNAVVRNCYIGKGTSDAWFIANGDGTNCSNTYSLTAYDCTAFGWWDVLALGGSPSSSYTFTDCNFIVGATNESQLSFSSGKGAFYRTDNHYFPVTLNNCNVLVTNAIYTQTWLSSGTNSRLTINGGRFEFVPAAADISETIPPQYMYVDTAERASYTWNDALWPPVGAAGYSVANGISKRHRDGDGPFALTMAAVNPGYTMTNGANRALLNASFQLDHDNFGSPTNTAVIVFRVWDQAQSGTNEYSLSSFDGNEGAGGMMRHSITIPLSPLDVISYQLLRGDANMINEVTFRRFEF